MSIFNRSKLYRQRKGGIWHYDFFLGWRQINPEILENLKYRRRSPDKGSHPVIEDYRTESEKHKQSNRSKI